MATTLRHDPNLYLHALLYHRSDQRYLQLKCLERLNYETTTQASLGISWYSLHMPPLCEVSRDVGSNDDPWADLRSPPLFSRKGLPKAISFLVMLLVIILAAVSENVLQKVLEWYAQHKNDPAPTQDDNANPRRKTTDIEEWDQKFMQVDHEIVLAANYMDIHKVTLAANYMDIKVFLGVDCKTVAKVIKSKPPGRKTSIQGRNIGQPSKNDADFRKNTTDIEEWDQKSMQVDREIVLAANYMDIKAFLDFGYKTVANMIKGEPPDKIHKTSAQGRKVGQTPQNDDADSRKTTTGIEEWDVQHVLVNLHELPIPFLDVGCKTVANMIKGKPPEEIRKTFNIQNDFTLEEEDQIRRENKRVDSRLEERNLLAKKKQPGQAYQPRYQLAGGA